MWPSGPVSLHCGTAARCDQGSRSRTTHKPGNEVSGTSAKHSRAKSSTIARRSAPSAERPRRSRPSNARMYVLGSFGRLPGVMILELSRASLRDRQSTAV
jgi:hypothetical protein